MNILDNYKARLIQADDVIPFFELITRNRIRLEDFFAGTLAKNGSLEDTAIYVEEVLKKIENRTYFPFLITQNRLEKLVGFIDIKSIDWNIPKGEIGFFIDKDYEGKGIMSTAVAEITKYCFNDLWFKKIFLRTHASNSRTRMIAEKNGFILEGKIRKDYRTTRGQVIDVLYYGIVNEN